ncbi:DUF7005 family protein, partial [Escherichia coli]|uniref:DUF7005 family protein n=1 Tax=Escherichia coli TaxID=562 RepID=UPI00195F29CC
VQKTAYRCEPNEIPKSMGAIMINGLNNWEKIHMSLEIKRNVSYLPNNDPSDSDFFNDKDNYQDSLIVLSSDFYSSLDASYTPYTKEEWLNISLEIR